MPQQPRNTVLSTITDGPVGDQSESWLLKSLVIRLIIDIITSHPTVRPFNVSCEVETHLMHRNIEIPQPLYHPPII